MFPLPMFRPRTFLLRPPAGQPQKERRSPPGRSFRRMNRPRLSNRSLPWETASGEEAAGEEAAGENAAPPDDAAPQEPQEPAPAEAQEPGDPAAPSDGAAGGVGAEPGETVLLLTDMIAPDGSVVRLDPRPAEGPAAQDAPEAAGAGAGSGKGAGEGALDPATQSELAATVREWLDRNAPELVDRAARRELQKLSDRQD